MLAGDLDAAALLSHLEDPVERGLGRAPEAAEAPGRQGAADTRFLNRYANTPTVIFGPGSTAVMHAG